MSSLQPNEILSTLGTLLFDKVKEPGNRITMALALYTQVCIMCGLKYSEFLKITESSWETYGGNKEEKSSDA